jgi:hemerythrin
MEQSNHMSRINKIKVSRGVYWVEVPDAGLSILCGCPADSVKHLMKRGLIVSREEHGVTFETGPNAILLSDVLIQNGDFSNLAEFPVLQMLYRQGMILPNHPKNTGEKPILIGSESQVKAQMGYIYRGNYGLISEQEMMAAGASSAEAREMMRMKVKFSFGRIQPTEELLESVIIKNKPIEIKNGVTISRRRLNVFVFVFQGESVEVNLNLPHLEKYSAPYPLSFHNVKREYFGIIHSGDGDGWDINRPSMASIMMFQGKIYLIDAGPNIIHSLTALGIGANEIEGVFHTHAHDDHFCGLATLMRSDHRIKYYATPLVRASVAKKLSALVSRDEDEFFNYFDTIDLQTGVWNDIGTLEVKPVLSPHPVETTIMLFRTKSAEGSRVYGHFADIVSLDVLADMVTDNPDQPGVSREFYERVAQDYLISLDLKKIDIGGGLIHGNAKDFKEDRSGKIILTHIARELTHEEKEIGSGAPYGMVDVLIPGIQDYFRMYSHQYLRSYFPQVSEDQLRMILNNPCRIFNPESILLKKGTVNDSLYLILSGEVEMILTEEGVHSTLSAGVLVGEISTLTQGPSQETYRAANFVHALQIPGRQYLDFVKDNGLYEEIQEIREKREFLQKSYLFSEAISYPAQNRIAQSMHLHTYQPGQDMHADEGPQVFMIQSGTVQLMVDTDVLETLGPGYFFGEGFVLFKILCLYKPRFNGPVALYHIRGDILLSIPIVRWKLNETYDKRMGMMLNPELISISAFEWRAEYNTNIREVDADHHELLSRANELHEAICNGQPGEILEDTLVFLIEYTMNHFAREETLMRENGYPEFETHRRKHHDLTEKVQDMKRRIQAGEMEMNMEFLDFLKEWVINHILTEDRKMTPFFAEKGIT